MFGYVESTLFFLFADSNSKSHFQNHEYGIGENEGEYADKESALDLHHQIKTIGEYCCGNGSPNAANSMNRDSSDWIVDLAVLQPPSTAAREHTASEAR